MDFKKIIPQAALMLTTAIPFSQPAQALEYDSNKASDLLPTAELETKTNIQQSNQGNIDKKKAQLEQILRISKPDPNTYCAAETSNDSIGSKPVMLNGGREATNDWGRNTFTIGQNCVEKEGEEGQFTGYKFRAHSDAYRGDTKFEKLTDSSSVTGSFGDINFNPTNTTYLGGSVSGIGLNQLAKDTQDGFHRTLNNIGFNTNEDTPVFKNNGPTGAALSIDGGIASQDLIPENPVNLNVYASGQAGIGHTDFNGTLPYAEMQSGLQLGYSFNNIDSNNRIPSPNGIIPSEVNNSKEVFIGLNGECSTNDQTDFLNNQGAPNDFCAVNGEFGVIIPINENSSIQISSETPPIHSTKSYRDGVNTSGTPIQIRYQRKH